MTQHALRAEALAESLPPNAAVSASSALVPRISRRPGVYVFPAVLDAEYVFLDLQSSPAPTSAGDVYLRVRALLAAGGWNVDTAEDGLLVLHRAADAAPTDVADLPISSGATSVSNSSATDLSSETSSSSDTNAATSNVRQHQRGSADSSDATTPGSSNVATWAPSSAAAVAAVARNRARPTSPAVPLDQSVSLSASWCRARTARSTSTGRAGSCAPSGGPNALADGHPARFRHRPAGRPAAARLGRRGAVVEPARALDPRPSR